MSFIVLSAVIRSQLSYIVIAVFIYKAGPFSILQNELRFASLIQTNPFAGLEK